MTDKIDVNIDEITKNLDELKDMKARLNFELNAIIEEIEKNELKLIAVIDKMGVNEMRHGIYSFGFKIIQRRSFNQKLFGEENPELLERYKRVKEKKQFEFKINK